MGLQDHNIIIHKWLNSCHLDCTLLAKADDLSRIAYTFDAIKVDSFDLLTFLFSMISSFKVALRILFIIILLFLLNPSDLSSFKPKIQRKSFVVQMFAPLSFSLFQNTSTLLQSNSNIPFYCAKYKHSLRKTLIKNFGRLLFLIVKSLIFLSLKIQGVSQYSFLGLIGLISNCFQFLTSLKKSRFYSFSISHQKTSSISGCQKSRLKALYSQNSESQSLNIEKEAPVVPQFCSFLQFMSQKFIQRKTSKNYLLLLTRLFQ